MDLSGHAGGTSISCPLTLSPQLLTVQCRWLKGPLMGPYPYWACGVHGKTQAVVTPTRSLCGKSKPSKQRVSPIRSHQKKGDSCFLTHITSLIHTYHITSHHSVDPSQAGSGSSPTPNTTYAHSCRILTPHLHPHTYPFSCTSILMHIHPHPYPSHHNPYSEIPPTHAHSSHTQHTRAYIYEVFVVYISQQG